MSKDKQKKDKKMVAKEMSQSQMEESSSKNPDDFEVRSSEQRKKTE